MCFTHKVKCNISQMHIIETEESFKILHSLISKMVRKDRNVLKMPNYLIFWPLVFFACQPERDDVMLFQSKELSLRLICASNLSNF